MVVLTDKIHVLDEAFSPPAIRMAMITIRFTVVTYHAELAPINLHGTLTLSL